MADPALTDPQRLADGVSAAVQLVSPGGVERSLGKARRVVDKRPK